MKKLTVLLILLMSISFISCDEETKDKDVKSLSTEDIANICNMEFACGLSRSNSINDCVTGVESLLKMDENSIQGQALKKLFSSDMLEIINCEQEAKDCTALAMCENSTIGVDCDNNSFVETCDGNKTVACNWQGKTVKTECGDTEECKVEDNEASCKSTEEKECNYNEYNGTCDGNKITYCSLFGTIVTASCTDMLGDGFTCNVKDSKANCLPKEGNTLKDCDEDTFESKCDGKNTIHCTKGKIATSDCEKLLGEGYLCQEDQDFFSAIIFSGCIYKDVVNSCTDKASCDGDTLHYCLNGQDKTYDCKGNGYAGCSLENGEGYCNY